MDLHGILKVKVIRGRNLVIRDFFSSDPYVKLKLADQVVKTHVKWKNLNPEWNEELTLSIPHPLQPLKVYVFDHDVFWLDARMGEVEIDLQPLLLTVRRRDSMRRFKEDDMILHELLPDSQNNLLKQSYIKWKNGHVVQELSVKLQKVERGELEIELTWIPII